MRMVSITLILSLFFVPIAQAEMQNAGSHPGPAPKYNLGWPQKNWPGSAPQYRSGSAPKNWPGSAPQYWPGSAPKNWPGSAPQYRPRSVPQYRTGPYTNTYPGTIFRQVSGGWYPPRPGYYNYSKRDNNKDIFIALGVAIVLGSIFSNINSSSGYSKDSSTTYNDSKNDLEYREKQEIKNSIRNEAENEAKRASSLVAERGIAEAINTLRKSWEDEGRRTYFEDKAGMAVIKITGFNDGAQITYSFYPENRKVFVKISVPKYSVSEEASEYYTDSPRNTEQSYGHQSTSTEYMPNNSAPILSLMQYAGFELANDKRSASGHMLIEDVAKGTAAYYAGLRRGDRLVKVDGYDASNYDPGWIKSYIADKYQSRALIKITFLQSGIEKKADIQL